jgi:hypothetical protein
MKQVFGYSPNAVKMIFPAPKHMNAGCRAFCILSIKELLILLSINCQFLFSLNEDRKKSKPPTSCKLDTN